MTIDEAIEILDLNIRQRSSQMPPDVLDALKLGIEAMKAIKMWRQHALYGQFSKLPGETKE